jgi:4-hydroxy-4-methyl-2-oxoglutarate aldolase
VTPVHPHIGELTGPKSAIHLEGFDRVPVGVVAAAQGLSAATLHEAAGKVGAMPGAIKPVHPEFRLCGPATTVHGPG